MVKKDYTRDELLTDYAKDILCERYLVDGETSPQDAFASAAEAFADDEEHAQRIYDYASNLWFMFATPVLSNGGTTRGLPISCFLNYIDDSRLGINEHIAENTWLASMGGGIGGVWSAIRSDGVSTSQGSKSTGMIPFMHIVDSQILAVNQGSSRRGGYASYLDISHPEIIEFINMRKPTGGDPNRKNLNLHHGINIPDSFMFIIEKCSKDPSLDDSWDLIDPHTKEVVETVSALYLWELILTTRMETGEPYLHFIDTSNRLRPDAYKQAGLEITQSNLCSEILIPTDPETTAVCCLSSVNLEKYDEWKDTDMVKDLIRMLDNVLDYFIENAPKEMHKAIKGATRGRDIGLGAMGFHAYLQSKGIPFESAMASSRNRVMFEDIYSKAKDASYELAIEKDSCPVIKECSFSIPAQRNVQLMAIAPNASSSIICGGTSPSVEPFSANMYTEKTQNGSNVKRNKFLDLTEEQWRQVSADKGSVQGLDLDKDLKDTFKTAFEIDQHWIIDHAASRQPFICQAQSINLFFRADVPKKYVHSVHFSAWKKSLKTLYYCRSQVVDRAEDINKRFDRFDYKVPENNECLSCEG